MPVGISSDDYFKTYKHVLEHDFKDAEGNDLPYAPGHPKIWGTEDKKITPPKAASNLALSKDNKLLAASSGGDIFIYDTESGELRQTLRDAAGEAHSVVFQPINNANIVVSNHVNRSEGKYEQYIRIWSLKENMQTDTAAGSDIVKEASLAASLAARKKLCEGGWTDEDVDETKLLARIEKALYASKLEADFRNQVALKGVTIGGFGSKTFSEDGKTLLCISERKTVIALDVESLPATGKFRTEEHGDAIMWKGFSPAQDSKLFATSCWDSLVRLFDSNSGQLIRVLEGGTGQSWSAAFSADGTMIAAGSGGKSAARIWNVETGQLLHTFDGFNTWVRNLDFSPDGKYFAAGGSGLARIFRLPAGEEVQTWKTEKDQKLGTSFNELFIGSMRYSRVAVLFFMTADGRVFGFDEKNGQKLYFGTAEDVSGQRGKGAFVVSEDSQFLYMPDHEGSICKWSLR